MSDDEPRDWEQVRTDAIKAVTAAATEIGPAGVVFGSADKLADAVLAVCEEEAVNRMAAEFADETRIKAIDFRNGAHMDLEPSKTLVAHWVAAAKTWLGDAPNYNETPVSSTSMEVKLAGEAERFVFILQRVGPGKLTPHEARKAAEARADRLRSAATTVLAAYQRLLDHDDLDGLRDALTGLQEATADD